MRIAASLLRGLNLGLPSAGGMFVTWPSSWTSSPQMPSAALIKWVRMSGISG